MMRNEVFLLVNGGLVLPPLFRYVKLVFENQTPSFLKWALTLEEEIHLQMTGSRTSPNQIQELP